MAWLAVLLLGFLATVLRGRRDLFARGVLASAFVALFLLHAADPEAAIVRANATLAHGFDVDYALRLHADAVPALIEVLPSLDPAAPGRGGARPARARVPPGRRLAHLERGARPRAPGVERGGPAPARPG